MFDTPLAISRLLALLPTANKGAARGGARVLASLSMDSSVRETPSNRHSPLQRVTLICCCKQPAPTATTLLHPSLTRATWMTLWASQLPLRPFHCNIHLSPT